MVSREKKQEDTYMLFSLWHSINDNPELTQRKIQNNVDKSSSKLQYCILLVFEILLIMSKDQPTPCIIEKLICAKKKVDIYLEPRNNQIPRSTESIYPLKSMGKELTHLCFLCFLSIYFYFICNYGSFNENSFHRFIGSA